MRIRPAEPRDAEAITALHAAGWRVGYGDFFPRHVIDDAIDARRDRWTGLLQSGRLDPMDLLVAEEDGVILGFCHSGPHEEHADARMIHSFYVEKSRWGTGAAPLLMKAALEHAKEAGYPHVYLAAFERSARARGFYEKTGFRLTGRTIEYELPGYGSTVDVEYELDVGAEDL